MVIIGNIKLFYEIRVFCIFIRKIILPVQI